jgi:hypothetical protein
MSPRNLFNNAGHLDEKTSAHPPRMDLYFSFGVATSTQIGSTLQNYDYVHSTALEESDAGRCMESR